MFKKEYDCFSFREQFILFLLISLAYFLSTTKAWYSVWRYHTALKIPNSEKIKTPFAVWMSNFSELENEYYGKMIRKAKTINDYYLCFVVAFLSGDQNDEYYILSRMLERAHGYDDLVLVFRLSPVNSGVRKRALMMID